MSIKSIATDLRFRARWLLEIDKSLTDIYEMIEVLRDSLKYENKATVDIVTELDRILVLMENS